MDEGPPNTAPLWVLEWCVDEPGIADDVVTGLLASVAPTGVRALPEPLQCRIYLRGLEASARAGCVTEAMLDALASLAALSARLPAVPAAQAAQLNCSTRLLLDVSGVLKRAAGAREPAFCCACRPVRVCVLG